MHFIDIFLLIARQEVVVTPENRTVASSDNFLRVNLIGDFEGYTTRIPALQNMYLVTPRKVYHQIVMDSWISLYYPQVCNVQLCDFKTFLNVLH